MVKKIEMMRYKMLRLAMMLGSDEEGKLEMQNPKRVYIGTLRDGHQYIKENLSDCRRLEMK